MKRIKKNLIDSVKKKILSSQTESYKSAVITIILAALLLVSFTIGAFIREYKHIQIQTTNKAKVITSLGRLAIQEPIWDLDFDSIDKTMSSLFYDNEVTSVEIKSLYGETLFHKTLREPVNDRQVSAPEYNVFAEEKIIKDDETETGYTIQNQNLGTIRIGVSRYFKEKELIQDFTYALAFILIILLLVCLSIMAILYQEKSNQYKIKTILDNMTDSVLTTDTNLVIKSCNKSTEKMFEYKNEEILGKDFTSLVLVDKNILKDWNENTEQYYSASHSEDINGLKKNGNLFPVEFNAGTIYLNNEKMYLISIRDITIRNEINKMKDEFVSVVSHELRTPLSSIIGSLKLVAAEAFGKMPEAPKNMIDIALNSSNELLSLINNILDIDKINNAKVTINFDNFSINELIKKTTENNEIYAKQHNAKLVFYDIEENIKITTDREKLGLVLTNLLSNAAKFSPEGAEVKIVLKKNEKNIRISVIDKGIGISDEDKEKVFEKFVQVDSTNTRRKGGSGLGLYISKTFIELMGGIIGVEDTPGAGSTFFIELPLINE